MNSFIYCVFCVSISYKSTITILFVLWANESIADVDTCKQKQLIILKLIPETGNGSSKKQIYFICSNMQKGSDTNRRYAAT